MNDEQVEIVARALFSFDFPPVDKVKWEDLSADFEQDHYRYMARAAIAAYRPLVIEECAKVANHWAEYWENSKLDAEGIATALRSMKEPSDG